MLEHGVGQTQIAFRIFKVNGVDLVRHGGRANLTRFQALLEIAQAHISPNVARQINQDGVGARNGVKQLGHVIVRLNLYAVGLERQAQTPVFCGSTWLCRLWHFDDGL